MVSQVRLPMAADIFSCRSRKSKHNSCPEPRCYAIEQALLGRVLIVLATLQETADPKLQQLAAEASLG